MTQLADVERMLRFLVRAECLRAGLTDAGARDMLDKIYSGLLTCGMVEPPTTGRIKRLEQVIVSQNAKIAELQRELEARKSVLDLRFSDTGRTYGGGGDYGEQ